MALRLFSVYGTRQRPDLALHAFVRALAAGEPVIQLGDGGSTRDYTHVRDVARGVLAALEWVDGRAPAFEIVNLGTGQPVRLDSLIAKAAGALDVSPRVTVRARHPADLQHSWADIGKAQALLGYAPRVDLDDGIAEFVTWYEATYGRESRTTA
jgi:UDP-glucuronate 4-epimerase